MLKMVFFVHIMSAMKVSGMITLNTSIASIMTQHFNTSFINFIDYVVNHVSLWWNILYLNKYLNLNLFPQKSLPSVLVSNSEFNT